MNTFGQTLNSVGSVGRLARRYVCASLASEFRTRMTRLLQNFTPSESKSVGVWFAKTFRFQTSRTPKGQKALKGLAEKFHWWLVVGGINAESQYNEVSRIWVDEVEPQLENLTRYFSDEGGITVPSEVIVGNRVYLNKVGFEQSQFNQYVMSLEKLFDSVQGWRKKAFVGKLQVALAGPKDFRGSAGGTYKSSEDVLYVRATPAVLKRTGGTYGALDYILIHELGHRYERKVRVPVDFDRGDWRTSYYSSREGEAFAELFALGHFRMTRDSKGSWDSAIQDRFEAIMSGSKAESIEVPPHLQNLMQNTWQQEARVAARWMEAAKPGSPGQKRVQQGRFHVWYLPKYEMDLETVLRGLAAAERLYDHAQYRLPDKIPVVMAGRAGGSQRSIYTTADGGFIQLVPSAFSDSGSFATFVHELAHYYHSHAVRGGFTNVDIRRRFREVLEEKAPEMRSDMVEVAQRAIMEIEKEYSRIVKSVRPGMTFNLIMPKGFGHNAPKVLRPVRVREKKGRGDRIQIVVEYLDPTPEETKNRMLGDTLGLRQFVEAAEDTVMKALWMDIQSRHSRAVQIYNDAVMATYQGGDSARYEEYRSKWFPTKYSKTNALEWFAELVTARLLAPTKMDPEVQTWLDQVAKTGSGPDTVMSRLASTGFRGGMRHPEALLKDATALDGARKTGASKYQKKKEVPKADGKGTTTVYEYSERQVANRHKEKADRVEKLRNNLHKLQSQVKKDLKSKDPKTRLCALAVGLMNDTYERVGNDESAKDGHVGVTGWTPEHVTIKDGKATFKYVGKSGVKQTKETKDTDILRVLKDVLKNRKKGETLFTFEGGRVDSAAVNEYLDSLNLGITAKDIRGLHANREVQERLKAIRSKGGELPKDKKEREKKLKEEFQKALDEAADAVGHEASTLRSQYLVPGLEDMFLKDGTVMTKLNEKKAFLDGVMLRHLVARYLEGVHLATKSEHQKEEKDVRQMLKSEPKKKPRREDLRRNRMRTEDPDLAPESDKDLSLNYKKVGHLARLVGRWLRVGQTEVERKPGDVWKSDGGRWTGKNPDGNSHTFDEKTKAEAYAQGKETKGKDPSKALKSLADALSAAKGKQIDAVYKDLVSSHPEVEDAVKPHMEAYQAANKALAKAAIKAQGLSGKDKKEALKELDDLEAERAQAIEAIRNLKVEEKGSDPSPKETEPKSEEAVPAKKAPAPKDPVTKKTKGFLDGEPLSETPLDEEGLMSRAENVFNQYRASSKKGLRQDAAEEAVKMLDSLDPESPQAVELNRVIDAIHLAMEMNGEQWSVTNAAGELVREPLDEKLGVLAKEMVGQGHARVLLSDSSDHYAMRESVRDALGRLDDSGLQLMSKDTPWEPLGDLLEGLGGMTLDPEVAELVRGLIRDLSINNLTTNQGVINAVAGKKMPPSNPLEVFEDVKKRFSARTLEEAIADLVSCVEGGQKLEQCREMADQVVSTQVQGMAENLEAAIRKLGVDPDPQNPHVAALRHAAETGDFSILDEKLEPAKSFSEQKAEFIRNMKNPEDRKRVQKMNEAEFQKMLRGVFEEEEVPGTVSKQGRWVLR